MNKLKINNKGVYLESKDDSLSFAVEDANKFLGVQTVKIKISNNTDLAIECEGINDGKFDICINVLSGVHVNIYEFKNSGKYKFQYKYYLEENSYLNVEKVINADKIHEMTIINLNGENANIDYNLKTISKNKEKYNFLVYHNASKTVSNIRNSGVNILNGEIEFNVSSFVPNDIKKCDVNQSARIINMTDNTCTIKPNLFIDEEDVVANHSALIGTFSFDEIFYLESRGINKKEAERLLIRGFLMKGITYHGESIKKIIDQYWG